MKYYLRKDATQDYPGGSVFKHLHANAGGMGSSPGLGRLHMPRATKPVCHNYGAHVPRARVLQQEKLLHWKAYTPQ